VIPRPRADTARASFRNGAKSKLMPFRHSPANQPSTWIYTRTSTYPPHSRTLPTRK
jgi:hypothetical protein